MYTICWQSSSYHQKYIAVFCSNLRQLPPAEMGCPAKNGEMKMIKCPTNISLRDWDSDGFCWYLLGLTQIMAALTNVGWHWGREESSVISWSGQGSGHNSASLAGVTSPALSRPLTAGEPVSDSWLVTIMSALIETLQSADKSQLSPPAWYCHSPGISDL